MSSNSYSNIADGVPLALDRAWEAKEELKVVAGMIKDYLTAADVFTKALAKIATSHPFPPSQIGHGLNTDNRRGSMHVASSLAKAYKTMMIAMQKTSTWLNGACVGVLGAIVNIVIAFLVQMLSSSKFTFVPYKTEVTCSNVVACLHYNAR